MAGVVFIVFHPSVWHRRIPRLALDLRAGELIVSRTEKAPGTSQSQGLDNYDPTSGGSLRFTWHSRK